MLFRQLFDSESSTYTYLLASRKGGEALIIDPVLARVERYIQLLKELNLKLVKVVDTHVHADHVTGMAELRDRTKCVTVMGEHAPVDVVSMRVQEGDSIDVEGVSLDVIYTPGHTICSYSYAMDDRVFTGDTLLIRGTGRTDFQSGSSAAQYDSLFNKLLKLPEETFVYPAHDYKGDTVSTIGEEKAFNPRLQVSSEAEYAEIMDNLNLDNPKMMDIAVPANMKLGLGQGVARKAAWALDVAAVKALAEKPGCLLVDLREDGERRKNGVIPGSVHAPYTRLDVHIKPGGILRAAAGDKKLIFYCAFGERSALAVDMAKDMGIEDACHLAGGIDAWKSAGGAIEKI
jgi:sulfur dioxygenase